MSIEIDWEAADPDDLDFEDGTGTHTTLLSGQWASRPSGAISAVVAIMEDYFDTRAWERWFGTNDKGSMRVRVHKPEAIAGEYTVELRQVAKASAMKVEAST